jgi:hypothetical protein
VEALCNETFLCFVSVAIGVGFVEEILVLPDLRPAILRIYKETNKLRDMCVFVERLEMPVTEVVVQRIGTLTYEVKCVLSRESSSLTRENSSRNRVIFNYFEVRVSNDVDNSDHDVTISM